MAPKKVKRRRYSNSTSNYEEESDNESSGSSDSEISKSQNFRKEHNVNKRGKTSYALRPVRYKRVINSDNSNDELKMIDSIVSSSSKKRDQQQAAPNFKPYINKVMEEFKQMFSKFTLQFGNLQMKHLKDKIITEDNAENIIFIISCIISKIKEELNDYQQKLNNTYLQQSMKNSCNTIVSNSESRKSSDTEDLQVQTKSSSDSTYSRIISTRRPKTFLTSDENSRHNSDFLESNNTTPSRIHIRNDIGESSSKENYTSSTKVCHNNSSSNNPKDVQLILHKLKDIHVIKKSAENSVLENKVTESNVLNLEALKSKLNETNKDLPLIEKDLYKNNFAEEKNSLGDDSSDVDSTCSTIALGHSRKNSMEEDDTFQNLTNTEIYRYISRSRSPSVELSTSLVKLDDTIQFYHSDSDESLIMMVADTSIQQTPSSKDVDHSLIKKATSPTFEMNQLIAKYPSVSIVRTNLPRKSTRNENKTDRTLTMSCRVLVEKLVLPNSGKLNNK